MASAHLSPEKNMIYPHRACLGGIMPDSYTSCPAHLSQLGSVRFAAFGGEPNRTKLKRESVGRSGSHQAACHRGKLGGKKTCVALLSPSGAVQLGYDRLLRPGDVYLLAA